MSKMSQIGIFVVRDTASPVNRLGEQVARRVDKALEIAGISKVSRASCEWRAPEPGKE